MKISVRFPTYQTTSHAEGIIQTLRFIQLLKEGRWYCPRNGRGWYSVTWGKAYLGVNRYNKLRRNLLLNGRWR